MVGLPLEMVYAHPVVLLTLDCALSMNVIVDVTIQSIEFPEVCH